MDESAAVRGAIRDFIEATTAYEVCGTVDDGASAIQKATERRCDLILLHLRAPISDSVEMASLLRSKLPHVKVVGFSSVELGSQESQATAFDAVIAKQDGLSKLVETLRALMPEPPRTATNSPG
ncbi:MAG TPA: response regulator [Candidatus Acidoferrum sp.]|nr:response regulator [Candidatus Acidoferrum sp.]